jgi:hypothetical protein
MPNNENPTKACFHAVWTAFIINYWASDKTAKGLWDFLWKAKKPAHKKLYDFKMQLYQLNKYLSLLTGPYGHHLDDDDMFHTIQECVPLEQFLHCLKHHDQKDQWPSWILWETGAARSKEEAENPPSGQ